MYSEDQVRRVLTNMGIDIKYEITDEFIILCPFHNNWQSPAGEVETSTGLFHCFSCGASAKLEDLVMACSGRTYFEAIRYIDNMGSGTDIETIINRQLVEKPEFVQFDQTLIERLHQDLRKSSTAMDYLHSRGITDGSMGLYSLGYSANQDAVTIPVAAPNGMWVGFVARGISEKKFLNTPKLPKSKTLFNLHRVKTQSTVYVVESSFDAIRLEQCGVAAVATLGAGVSNKQIELLSKYFNHVVVVPDNDEAGKDMVYRMTKKMSVDVVSVPEGKKDIGDLTDEEIKNLIISVDDPIRQLL